MGAPRHLLARPHPVTGEMALYCPCATSRGIEGMEDEEARELLTELTVSPSAARSLPVGCPASHAVLLRAGSLPLRPVPLRPPPRGGRFCDVGHGSDAAQGIYAAACGDGGGRADPLPSVTEGDAPGTTVIGKGLLRRQCCAGEAKRVLPRQRARTILSCTACEGLASHDLNKAARHAGARGTSPRLAIYLHMRHRRSACTGNRAAGAVPTGVEKVVGKAPFAGARRPV